MKAWGIGAAVAALLTLALAVPASAVPLNAYKVNISGAKELRALKAQGFDITEGHRNHGRTLEIVGTDRQIAKLRSAGVTARLMRDRRGRTARRASAAQAAAGWQVWRPYARTDVAVSDAAGNPGANLKTQLERLARRYRHIAKLETIGHTLRGLPIYAMKVTRNARTVRDGRRPAVLYSSVQHAREWLAGETGRRTLRMFLDNYSRDGLAIGTDNQPIEGVSSREIRRLVNTRELWFILIANPDGYDYTFTPANRLWRKNLRDNDRDGEITTDDGVDLNRNFPTRWFYDDEGSSSQLSSETYRGTEAASEPETKAFTSLTDRVDFAWNKNDHTHGRLLLYPYGWQIDTHAADEPIFRTIAGDDEEPAIPTFDPDLGAELYTTNGDTNDHLYAHNRTISFTPEGTPGEGTGSGFIFPDDEALVQAEFERHVQFALDLARSADDPSRPESWLGNRVPNFEVDEFKVSFGSPQTVEVNARRDLGPVSLHYQINNGPVRTRSTSEWEGGKRYGDEGDYWYHRMRGRVTGADPGDRVKVWFSADGDKESDAFSYQVRSDSGADVLVLAQEDYSGNSAFPPYPNPNGPHYLSYYTQALEANSIDYDVWNYDAEGRTAPDPLGVLSHYDAVIWYSGNDNVTRPTQEGGETELANHRTTMAVRDFVNEGGRVAFTGVNAGRQHDLVEYAQAGTAYGHCDGSLLTTDGGKCNPLSNDFLQYYLGSYVRSDGGGLNPEGGVFPVAGSAGSALAGFMAELNGADSAGNQEFVAPGIATTATHLVTSSVLPESTHPQFASRQAADWLLEGGAAFDPHGGTKYMYSQNADRAYKRLTRTIDLSSATTATLRFWTSYNTEAGWDHVFVEARTAGGSDWTTLPDANGHTSQETGDSCASGWSEELHHRLRNYVTYDPAGEGSCTPTGTTGDWHAASGNSGGWKQWEINLDRYAGSPVELSIVYATDWSTLTVPGVLVDDTEVVVDGAVTASTGFEDDLGGWTVPGAHPEGPSTNSNDWIQSERIPFEDASVTQSEFGLLFGFGLEGVNGAAKRAELMGRTVEYLLAEG
jgi:hypothetical protein